MEPGFLKSVGFLGGERWKVLSWVSIEVEIFRGEEVTGVLSLLSRREWAVLVFLRSYAI